MEAIKRPFPEMVFQLFHVCELREARRWDGSLNFRHNRRLYFASAIESVLLI